MQYDIYKTSGRPDLHFTEFTTALRHRTSSVLDLPVSLNHISLIQDVSFWVCTVQEGFAHFAERSYGFCQVLWFQREYDASFSWRRRR
jgi:hypothetical protein